MNTTVEDRSTKGQIIWGHIVGLTNEGKSITRQIIRELTGYSYDLIDDHIKKFEAQGKVMKVGKGLIELIPTYPAERPQSLSTLPDGMVVFEIGDEVTHLSPIEAQRHGMLFAGFARQYHDLENSSKALIRTVELADRIRELERKLAAATAPRDEAQMELAIQGGA